MIIKNKEELSITQLREKTINIIEAGIKEVLPSNLMRQAVKFDKEKKVLTIQGKEYDVSNSRIFVVGGGKAAGLMAEALEDILGTENISGGVLTCKENDYSLKKIKIIKASHPIPNKAGTEGVKEMLDLRDIYSIGEKDIVLCLLSGGGSSLLPYPVKEINLEDKQEVTKLLLKCGAEIHEINTVRKHLSKIKGGRLGEFYSMTKVMSLILSDVVGNDLDVIASGPTYPDSSTYSDALSVLEKYDLLTKASKSIIDFLEKGERDEFKETPKELNNCDNYIIGDNKLALLAMKKKAEEIGFSSVIITSEEVGNPALVAEKRAKEILEGKYTDFDVVLLGGETTPQVPEKSGKGGRNQHYAAVSLLALKDYPKNWVLSSFATDGADFLPGVGGALIDNNTVKLAKKLDVQSYIDNYDTYNLFEKLGNSLIKAEHTGTNVGDVVIYILEK